MMQKKGVVINGSCCTSHVNKDNNNNNNNNVKSSRFTRLHHILLPSTYQKTLATPQPSTIITTTTRTWKTKHDSHMLLVALILLLTSFIILPIPCIEAYENNDINIDDESIIKKHGPPVFLPPPSTYELSSSGLFTNLEESIRNEVKNEIEMHQNFSSVNALLESIPELEERQKLRTYSQIREDDENSTNINEIVSEKNEEVKIFETEAEVVEAQVSIDSTTPEVTENEEKSTTVTEEPLEETTLESVNSPVMENKEQVENEKEASTTEFIEETTVAAVSIDQEAIEKISKVEEEKIETSTQSEVIEENTENTVEQETKSTNDNEEDNETNNEENVEVTSQSSTTEPIATTHADSDFEDIGSGALAENANTMASLKGSRSISAHRGFTDTASRNLDGSHPPNNSLNGKLNVESASTTSSSEISAFVIGFCSGIAVLFVLVSATIFVISYRRQQGILDIELQEKRCGKDNLQEEDAETHIKLLEIELPAPTIVTALTCTTEDEATDECP